ncbi:MAG: DNA gyrase subunit A [Clostridia bacterium]|nr:DNA gyrase subunit A [Clostridia bacterium]
MDINYENQKIVPVDIEKEVKQSFLEYAMSVIVSRALPDVRDGLKPIHRRILYTMYNNNLLPERAYRKSASTVGDVMGNYHPHGDAAVYDALVRLAQTFSMRYPLVDGHGNFGSVDGDPPAAQRYTEAKMTKLSVEMLGDIEKDTVDFMPNYDNRLMEPTVLPSRFPNLLVNGSMGIAVGMATNIPPHNLREVIDASLYMIDHPDAEMDDLMQFVKGPDFPTGAVIMGRSGIRAAYATGHGTIRIRSKAEIEEYGNGRYRIAVSEIPYMVNKARMIEHIAELHKDKKIDGISDLRDESDREGLRVVIELRKDANPQVVLNQLYSYTELQSNFTVNLIALVNNQPKTLSLRECIYHYIRHQREVVYRRTRFNLRRAMERAHIREGLKIAVDNIDKVVHIIRTSRTEAEAKARLMEEFKEYEVLNLLKVTGDNSEDQPDKVKGLTEVQAQAIVNMRLGQLTNLAAEDLENEYNELMRKIAEYEEIISCDANIYAVVKEELAALRDKYGDDRRTAIEAVEDDLDIEDLIKEEDNVFTMTRLGYIKRLPVSTYRQQKRGGRGITGLSTREEDAVEKIFICSTHDYILFFTNTGKMFRLKGYQIPEGGRTARGANIVNYLQLSGDERVTSGLCLREYDDRYLFLVTKKGVVKRTRISDLETTRKAGIRALVINEGDELVSSFITDGDDTVILCSKKGFAVRFNENTVRCMGRSAVGVIGMRLEDDDEIIGAAKTPERCEVLTITENGYGKKTPIEEFSLHGRGGKGMILHTLTKKTGDVAGMVIPDENEEDILIISSSGTIIRTAIEGVRRCGRASQGVIVMRAQEDEKIISIAAAAAEPEEAVESVSDEEIEETSVETETDEI